MIFLNLINVIKYIKNIYSKSNRNFAIKKKKLITLISKINTVLRVIKVIDSLMTETLLRTVLSYVTFKYRDYLQRLILENFRSQQRLLPWSNKGYSFSLVLLLFEIGHMVPTYANILSMRSVIPKSLLHFCSHFNNIYQYFLYTYH